MIKQSPNKNQLENKLENSLTFQLLYTAIIHKTFRRRFHNKFIDKNISPDVTSILYFMTQNPDISQTELAKCLFKGKAHTGKILNEMERQGLIKRETKEHSIKNIILPKGQALHQKAFKEFLRMKEIMHKSFTNDEINQFISYIIRYRNTLSSVIDVKLK